MPPGHVCLPSFAGEQAGVKGGQRPAKRTLDARQFADTLISGGQEAHPEPVRRRGLPALGRGKGWGRYSLRSAASVTKSVSTFATIDNSS